MLTVLLLGALVGAIMGLTGSGGGILAVPVLVLSLGWSVSEAMPVALTAVALSATVGALDGLRKGLARYRAAFLMAIVGVPFSSLGMQLGQVFSPNHLLMIFSLLLLMLAVRDFRHLYVARRQEAAVNADAVCHIDPHTGRFAWSWLTALMIGGVGAITGLFTGLLGVGGGFVMVPLLRRISDVSVQGIVATVLLVMALVSMGGIAMAAYHGLPIPLGTALPFALSTTAGMVLGRLWGARIAPHYLQTAFAGLLLLVAFAMAAKGFMA